MADRFLEWVAAYEAAWRTPGTAGLATLFTEDATYRPAPYASPLVGLPAIAAFWEGERTGPDEAFTLTAERVAAEESTGVIRLQVDYDGPPARAYCDLWIVVLTRHGRCRRFEEWPFFPDQARTAR